jgi:hypothetical protein
MRLLPLVIGVIDQSVHEGLTKPRELLLDLLSLKPNTGDFIPKAGPFEGRAQPVVGQHHRLNDLTHLCSSTISH